MQQLTKFWQKNLINKIVVVLIGVIVLCCSCALLGSLLPKSKAATGPTPDTQATGVALASTMVSQTQEAMITPSPVSTATPRPTNTPLPPPTATQAPIILTGSGDSVVDVTKDSNPAIMKIKYQGGSNFAITNYDNNNNRIDLLVNTIGSYQGTVPLDFLKDEHTARFEITAAGPWELQILPLSQVRHESIPGTIQGSGDDVIYLDGSNPDLLKADASTETSNFVIYGYNNNSRDLLVNEIAPYTGTVLMDRTTFMIVINAEGKWTLDITTK
jgi:hypothetical protein